MELSVVGINILYCMYCICFARTVTYTDRVDIRETKRPFCCLVDLH